LPYAANDTAPANNRFGQIAVDNTTPNGTAGLAAVDSTTRVGAVRTNSSAVIP